MNKQTAIVMLVCFFSASALALAPPTDSSDAAPDTVTDQQSTLAPALQPAQSLHQLTLVDVKPDPMLVKGSGTGSSRHDVTAENFAPQAGKDLPVMKLKAIVVSASRYPGYGKEVQKACYFPPGDAMEDEPGNTDARCVDLTDPNHLTNYVSGKPFGPGAQVWIMHIAEFGTGNKLPDGPDRVTFLYEDQ